MDIVYQHGFIDRDATLKLPIFVPEYEVPVLEAIHGEEAIVIDDSLDEEQDVGDLTAAEALNGMLRKYSQHGDLVRSVYRNPRALSSASGLPYKQGDDEAAKQKQSVVLVDGKKEAAPKSKKAADKGDSKK